MKRYCWKLLIIAAFAAIISSCVKEEYDLDNLDLTVKIGGDKLAFPLGETDSIKIKNLLNSANMDFLQKYGDMYSFRLDDTIAYDFSSQLPDIKGQLTVAEQSFDKDIAFSFGDNDPGRGINIDDFAMEFLKNPFNLSSTAIAALKVIPGDPVTIPASIPSSFALGLSESSVEVLVELPDGVNDIDQVVFGPDAIVEITTELTYPILSSGSVTPDIEFNPSDLFIINNQTIPFSLTTPLNSANNYKAVYTYSLSALKIKPSDIEGSNLVINRDASIEGRVSLTDASVSKANIDNINNMGISVKAVVKNLDVASIEMNSLSLSIDEQLAFNLDVEGIDEIYSLDSILIDGAVMSMELGFTDLPDFGDSPLTVDFNIGFPEQFKFKDSRIDDNNVMHITGEFENNKFTIDPITVRGLKFNGQPLNGRLSIEDEISIAGSVSAGKSSLTIDEITAASIRGRIESSISSFTPSKLYGIIDYDIDPINQELTLNNIPEFLRSDDCVLDVENPHIALSLNSNVGIPVDGVLSIIPSIGGEIREEGVIELNIYIPMCEEGELEKVTNYWISADRSSCPEGYVFLEADLSELIKKIPDGLFVILDAELNDDEQHYIDIDTKYRIELSYDLVVPLVFGDEFQISLRDTLIDIPKFISETLRSSTIDLLGSVTNSLPFQLELGISALDSHNNPVNVFSTKQTINSCDALGKPSVSALNVKLSAQNGSFNDITSLILNFDVTSGNASGVPITDDSFVKADLKVMIEGGITLDLNEKK